MESSYPQNDCRISYSLLVYKKLPRIPFYANSLKILSCLQRPKGYKDKKF